MQNLIVLCQHCFTWVEPHSEMCPECRVEVILDLPDPNRDTLAEILGTPLMVLGPVRVERPALPSYGELVGTNEGVLFLPRLHRRLNGAWEEVSSVRLPGWWPFGGDLKSPRFLDWLRRPLSVRFDTETTSDEAMEPGMASLVDRLMDSPGAFFVEHRFIRAVTSRRRIIKLDRSPMRSITFVDESEDGSLRTSLDSLAAQAARQGV